MVCVNAEADAALRVILAEYILASQESVRAYDALLESYPVTAKTTLRSRGGIAHVYRSIHLLETAIAMAQAILDGPIRITAVQRLHDQMQRIKRWSALAEYL